MTDVPLFPGYEPPQPVGGAGGVSDLSAGQRLTLRQAGDILRGVHPLTLSHGMVFALHPEADRTRTADSGGRDPFTCGTCAHRFQQLHHNKTYPKCDLGPRSGGPATDVRAWWPGCTRYEEKTDE